MATPEKKIVHADLPTSDKHLPLRNQPGEEGDSRHDDHDKNLDDPMKDSIDTASSDTQIASALKKAVEDDD